MGVAFPGESAEYRAARDRLLSDEIELRRAMEAVAAARRALPPGGTVAEDYVFRGQGAEGDATDVRLSELFASGKDSLVIYSFMFPRDGETIRHFWGSELFYATSDPGQDPRHVGTLEPVWNLFDLTPEGRSANWDEQLRY